MHVPGHAAEANAQLDAAVAGQGRVYLRLGEASNARPLARAGTGGALSVLRRGGRGTVVTVGPLADRTLAAVADLDVTVLYAPTVRPFDAATLRATLGTPDVVLVEPYLRGTSTAAVTDALSGVRHRLLSLGVGVEQTRRHGTAAEHDTRHGLDEPGIRAAVTDFLDQAPD